MMYETIIEPEIVLQQLNNPDWIVVDCRFQLADSAWGTAVYAQSHIPGAVYAHLDDDLSGPPVSDAGRHPLPTPEKMVQLFSRLGIDDQKQVVAYDSANGMLAARLWWMLRYMGHTAVAVLNGGWPAWEAAGYPVQSGVEENNPTDFSGAPRADWLVVLDEVSAQPLLVDSRAGERYRGEVEPLDKQAGHIPGAVNFPYAQNLDENGRFLPPAQLRQQFSQLLGGAAAEQTTFYCGSGVSACVNLLALVHAGLGNSRLYVGSWSEWSSDPSRPVATG